MDYSRKLLAANRMEAARNRFAHQVLGDYILRWHFEDPKKLFY